MRKQSRKCLGLFQANRITRAEDLTKDCASCSRKSISTSDSVQQVRKLAGGQWRRHKDSVAYALDQGDTGEF